MQRFGNFLQQGKVYVAGYPYGMPFTITEGSVSSPKQLMDGKYYIQTDAAGSGMKWTADGEPEKAPKAVKIVDGVYNAM